MRNVSGGTQAFRLLHSIALTTSRQALIGVARRQAQDGSRRPVLMKSKPDAELLPLVELSFKRLCGFDQIHYDCLVFVIGGPIKKLLQSFERAGVEMKASLTR